MKIVDVLARNIRERREELGMTQEDLARAARVTSADVSRIENRQVGSRGIGSAKLERLAVALRWSPSELLHA